MLELFILGILAVWLAAALHFCVHHGNGCGHCRGDCAGCKKFRRDT